MKIQHGYTLIEILVVMLIIAIVSSVAALSIHFNRNKEIENLKDQLQNEFRLAEVESIVQSKILSASFSDKKYQLNEYNSEKKSWRVTKEIILPDFIELTLKGKIIFSPSGELSPFVLMIAKKGEAPRYRLKGFANGDINDSVTE